MPGTVSAAPVDYHNLSLSGDGAAHRYEHTQPISFWFGGLDPAEHTPLFKATVGRLAKVRLPN